MKSNFSKESFYSWPHGTNVNFIGGVALRLSHFDFDAFFDTLRFTFDTSPFDFDTSPFDFDAFNFKAF